MSERVILPKLTSDEAQEAQASAADGELSPGSCSAGSPGQDLRSSVGSDAVEVIKLTPRLFQAIVGTDKTSAGSKANKHCEAFVPTIAGSGKDSMSKFWCPVIIEKPSGQRRVVCADRLAVRQFRKTIAEDLRHVQAKRQRLLQRLDNIRKGNPPKTDALISRLRREIKAAEMNMTQECLVPALPADAHDLHVLVEVTPAMVQLGMVCAQLAEELPLRMQQTGVRRLHLRALVPRSSRSSQKIAPQLPAALNDVDCSDESSGEVWQSWLESLAKVSLGDDEPLATGRGGRSPLKETTVELAPLLRRLVTQESFDVAHSAVVLIACSAPLDFDCCLKLLRKSQISLQIGGVFGLAPEDPEQAFEQMVGAGAVTSQLKLFFGRTYWQRYITVQQQELERLCKQVQDCPEEALHDSSLVSSAALEYRLIERFMRECFAEEQRCVEEIVCACDVLRCKPLGVEEAAAAMGSGLDLRHAVSHAVVASSRH